jgi:hypothetical protein
VYGLWNGPTTATISNNKFTLTGASMIGVQLVNPSSTDKLTVTAAANTFDFDGSGGIGIKTTAGSTAFLQYQSNTMTFDGTNGIGMQMSLTGAADVWLATNTITDNAGGGTGVLVDTVGSGSRMQLDGNTIQMLSSSATIDRGIIFSAVPGTLSLFSTTNNVVNGTTTPFSMPAGSITGTFLINNVSVP